MSLTPLLPRAALPDPGARGLTVTHKGERLSLFVVQIDGLVSAFVNRCPHRGLPLEWEPDRFLTAEQTHILCSVHGAVFRPTDGHCLYGPCSGQRLRQLEVVEENGVLHLMDP